MPHLFPLPDGTPNFSKRVEKWETECRQRIARLDELRLFDSGVHGRILFEG